MKKSLAHLLEDKQDKVELAGILPRETDEQKKLFALLDYAYIGARYDRSYKITKKQLEYLAQQVKKLQRLTKKYAKKKTKRLYRYCHCRKIIAFPTSLPKT